MNLQRQVAFPIRMSLSLVGERGLDVGKSGTKLETAKKEGKKEFETR
ncbi:hypothetical protein LEP1GSC202_3166 [Leptospira yanagawae serovar Saopaulo str. Sao Paulo = ATCC 700523]|uniref:Uncharacterized protein n=1 Tax=Leptospira yanagawae serovar Saopaulo str. Sao Paulo = ATCC 700523 TaxID=1249483 RepID=A0A5E8H9V4_9LEPT|nr:hypothetical protein LEP1GSC202_3166 [Leptospira yanagawae serovar Saopaulo str. Sao Paulo = ATCC 700523]